MDPPGAPTRDSTKQAGDASGAAPSSETALPPSTVATLGPAPYRVERLLDASVTSIAVGKPPKLAAFGTSAYIFAGDAWVERPLPPLPQEEIDAAIFFGRDDQPRLLGVRRDAQGNASPLYLRHKRVGWRPEPSELGALAGVDAPLYGILGHNDPEIVCAVGAFCLVKRLSGWKRIDAREAPERFFFTSQGAYVARDSTLLLLDDASWTPVAPVTEPVVGVCHDGPERLWVLTPNKLLHRTGTDPPEVLSVPVGMATALACAPGQLWITGSDGVALRVGDEWLHLEGVPGAVTTLAIGHDAVLLGGERGLYAARPAT